MSIRVKKLKDRLLSCDDKYSLERAEIVTGSYLHNADKPPIMQRAMAFADIMNKSTLYVNEDDLLVGNLSPQMGERPLYPEFHIGVTSHGKTGSVGEKINIKEYPALNPILEWWEGKDLFCRIEEERPKGVKWMQEELIINSAAEVNGHGHIVVDNRRILENGFGGLIESIKSEMDNTFDHNKKLLCEASLIALEGVAAYCKRYAKLLHEEITQDKDVSRQNELADMVLVMENISEKAPNSFHEALQIVAITYVTLHHEHNGYSISLGRLDKDLYPYYKADIEKGILTREQALELIECFCLKIMELPIGGVIDNKTAAITTGGLNVDGSYECNDVSYLFLETVKTLQLNSPALIVRWHEKAPQQFKETVVNMLKYGTGYPGIFGDKAVVRAMMEEHGATAAQAHNWTEVGCAEVYMTGESRPVDAGLVNLPVCLVLALNNGASLKSGNAVDAELRKTEDISSIDDVIECYDSMFNYLLNKELVLDRIIKGIHRDMRPVPFTNALMTNCISNGRDLLDKGEPFDLTCVGLFSYANLINSLIVIDELVFKSQTVTLANFIEALKKNFTGYENLYKKIKALPKYGNNDERVDKFIPIVNDIHYRARKNIMVKHDVDVSYETIPREVHIDLGLVSPATFDGRKENEPFADGASPSQGDDINGITSLLNSVMKLDGGKHITNGYVLNIKVLPALIDKVDFKEKLIHAIDIYFNNKGQQIQISCTRPEDLIAAQKNPEQYKNLIVRVAGFSAYFVRLRPELQKEVISRTLYKI